MKEIDIIVEQMLRDTIKHCKFKKAWLPKGWACVEIKSFCKELKERISKTHK
jgi:hypothetical protein